MKKKNKRIAIYVTIVLISLIVGGFLGAKIFSKTEIVNINSDNGEFCYQKDMMLYSATSVVNLPINWQENGVQANLCSQVNGKANGCYMLDVCPNCATNKISCVCLK